MACERPPTPLVHNVGTGPEVDEEVVVDRGRSKLSLRWMKVPFAGPTFQRVAA